MAEKFSVEQKVQIVIESFSSTNIAELQKIHEGRRTCMFRKMVTGHAKSI